MYKNYDELVYLSYPDRILECINELNNLCRELDALTIKDKVMTSSGRSATEIQNTIEALLKYKEQLKDLIQKSCNFAYNCYQNDIAADTASSVKN